MFAVREETMSPRVLFFTLFVIPVFAGRGGGGHRGGYGGHSHSYPSSHGLSGSHNHVSHTANTRPSYPHSATGLSGNSPSRNFGSHKTEVHHHYHYSPPQQINYGNGYHPVYRGQPPAYIYEYRDSGSRFDTLLTGLALYNLGRMSAHHDHYNGPREYHGNPGEKCKFVIIKDGGDYMETLINCQLMSSFIWEHESSQNRVESKTVTVTKVENTVKTYNDSSSTTTVNKTEVVEDALKVKGPSISVTPGMRCYMIRVSRDSTTMRKTVDCGLLQTYAVNSFRSNSSRNMSVITSLITLSCVLRLVQ